ASRRLRALTGPPRLLDRALAQLRFGLAAQLRPRRRSGQALELGLATRQLQLEVGHPRTGELERILRLLEIRFAELHLFAEAPDGVLELGLGFRRLALLALLGVLALEVGDVLAGRLELFHHPEELLL